MSMCIGAMLLSFAVSAPAEPSLLTLNIKDNLEASVVRVLPEHGQVLAAQIARLLRWRGDINRELHRGDSLEALYEPSPTEGVELVALRYLGSQISLRAYRFSGGDGVPRYYDEAGMLIEPGMNNAPVPGYVQITETVQNGRGRRKHKGLDLKAPEGAPIRLPFAGVVTRTNWMTRLNGHCIEIALDAGGRIAHFLHLSKIDPGVRPGTHLVAGTALGAVGSTGHSNAAHLHYEILSDGKPLEPLSVHGRRVVRLDTTNLASFQTQRDAFDRILEGPAAVGPMEFSADCLVEPPYAQQPLCSQTQRRP
jgi:murein DD-endopeptidase